MIRLASILYSTIATSLAGIGVIAVLSAGYVSVTAIVVASVAGSVLGLPVSLLVAKQILKVTKS
ncbi:MAG: hypothetical protein P8P70_11170 [Sulfitobacter sp.]|nr:hypothetical protein [Sulfitobacter sp.]